MRPYAGALLEPYYQQAERWKDLVIALESQLAAAAEPDRRRGLFFRIADVEHMRLGQSDSAFETLTRAFREHLVKKEGRKQLEELAVAWRRARELASMWEDSFAQSKDLDLLRELAHLYDGAAADPQAAKSAWERLVQAKPNDSEALQALETLHASGDNPT